MEDLLGQEDVPFLEQTSFVDTLFSLEFYSEVSFPSVEIDSFK